MGELSSLSIVVAGAVVAGLGQGLSFRTGLAAVNQAAPPTRRAEAASGYFVVAYVAISVPVVGCGVVAELQGVRVAGSILAAMRGPHPVPRSTPHRLHDRRYKPRSPP